MAIWFAAISFLPAAFADDLETYQDPKTVRIAGGTVVVAAHLTEFYDETRSAKAAADAVMGWAQTLRHPIIHLHGAEDGPYYEQVQPTYRLYSAFGAFEGVSPWHFAPDHIVLLGGHWDGCFKNTSKQSFEFLKKRRRDTRITYVTAGIYDWNQANLLSVKPADFGPSVEDHLRKLRLRANAHHHVDLRIDDQTVRTYPRRTGHKITLNFVRERLTPRAVFRR
jgi:hypothetical protein